MSCELTMACYSYRVVILLAFIGSSYASEWARKLKQNSQELNSRVHRSAFLDPNEIGVNSNHEEMHQMEHMASQNNNTNVQSDDPHDKNKQFCVDISEYLDLKWVIKESEECIVNFNRNTFSQLFLSKLETSQSIIFIQVKHLYTN